MIRIFATTALTLCLLLFGGCKQGDSSGKESDYETTKKMVLDILKSDDGKKAIVDMMSDEKIKKQLVIASDIVQDAIDKDRKSTRLNSSHVAISYAVFCLKKQNYKNIYPTDVIPT